MLLGPLAASAGTDHALLAVAGVDHALLAASAGTDRALQVVAIVGAVFTVLALVRVLLLLRAGASRELVTGWIGLMLLAGVIVFVLQRIAA